MPASRAVSGFTLIDLAIMITVIAMLAASFLSGKRLDRETGLMTTTDSNLDKIQSAINYYYARNGFLPCPAPRTASPTGTTFRVADCTGSIGIVNYTPSGGDAVRDVVRIGLLPTRTLGLPDSYGVDSWGDTYSYAMVKALSSDVVTSNNWYTTLTNGTIDVLDVNGNHITTGAGNSIAYIVVSHGYNGKGAYTSNDVLNSACGNSSTGYDYKNCDDDNVFVDAPLNETQGAAYFDDIVRWERKIDLGK